MEGHCFLDLKRGGIAKKTLNEYAENEINTRPYLEGVRFEDQHIRHPIPQTVIDVSEGYLKQNPGY